MQGNPLDNLNPGEIKLLKLYKQRESLFLKIIDLLNLESVSINEGDAPINNDGTILEEYLRIEKCLVTKLFGLTRVIKSFELIGSIYSAELDHYRTKAAAYQKTIQELHNLNRNSLKSSLERMSLLIDSFSRKSTYASSFSGQTPPQFIDVRI